MSNYVAWAFQPPVKQIRWMIRRDMDEVRRIEWASFEFPWTEEDFVRCLRQRNCIGMVAEGADDRVIGYMIYELHRTRLHLLNFAVSPLERRCGVGRQLLGKLLGKISVQKRSRLSLEVRESNVAAQLFFKSNGFKYIDTLKDHYEDTAEDAYVLQRRAILG